MNSQWGNLRKEDDNEVRLRASRCFRDRAIRVDKIRKHPMPFASAREGRHDKQAMLGPYQMRQDEEDRAKHTLVATPSFLGAAAFFLVTPVGFAAFALATGLVVVVVAVVAVGDFFALGLVVRLMAGAVSTVWKTRGLELPVADRVPSRGIFASGQVGNLVRNLHQVLARDVVRRTKLRNVLGDARCRRDTECDRKRERQMGADSREL